jgi:hypothetical protein
LRPRHYRNSRPRYTSNFGGCHCIVVCTGSSCCCVPKILRTAANSSQKCALRYQLLLQSF